MHRNPLLSEWGYVGCLCSESFENSPVVLKIILMEKKFFIEDIYFLEYNSDACLF